MTKPIDRFVSENRRATRRIDSTFVQVASQRRRQFDFGVSRIHIPTSIEVYTRPLNDGLYSGHPDPVHGSGRGTSGDRRGAWQLVTNEEVSEAFVKEGRNAVRDALNGDTTAAIDRTLVGSGQSTATGTNTQLESQTGSAFAWGKAGASANETLSRSHFLFGEFGDAVSEFGVESGSGRLYNRITTTTVNPSKSEELRVDVLFEVDGEGRGNAAFTNEGDAAVAETIRSQDSAVGIEEFAFGTGSTDPTKSDTMMENESFSQKAGRALEPEVITSHTTVLEHQPSTQPVTISEIGLRDNTGRLIWRTTIDGYEKSEDVEFEVFAAFRAK